MSYTRTNQVRCDTCNLFIKSGEEDTGIAFGCVYSSSGDIEPLEPEHWCKKCAEKEYQKAVTARKLTGSWQKPQWEIRAASELGLTWIDTTIGEYGSQDKYPPYRYVPNLEYERLKDVVVFPKQA